MFFRTDMAVERRDVYKAANKIKDEINGVKCEQEEIGDSIVTRVKIYNKEGAKALQRKMGNYITIDIKKLNNITLAKEDEIIKIFSDELRKIIDKHIEKDEEILIVGLGNLYSTPDSLGAKVVQNLEITRHIKIYLPNAIDKNARTVSAITPGVLGTTGIETIEIVKGIVDNINPKLVIAIDSLCTKNINRINKSIQISDTGIIPGGGVGNKQEELSKKTLNVPVIGVGVPTVVDLGTIIDEGLDIFINKLQEKTELKEYLNKVKNKYNYEEIKKTLVSNDYNMIVTPKEIDDLIDNMKDIIAKGINSAV